MNIHSAVLIVALALHTPSFVHLQSELRSPRQRSTVEQSLRSRRPPLRDVGIRSGILPEPRLLSRRARLPEFFRGRRRPGERSLRPSLRRRRPSPYSFPRPAPPLDPYVRPPSIYRDPFRPERDRSSASRRDSYIRRPLTDPYYEDRERFPSRSRLRARGRPRPRPGPTGDYYPSVGDYSPRRSDRATSYARPPYERSVSQDYPDSSIEFRELDRFSRRDPLYQMGERYRDAGRRETSRFDRRIDPRGDTLRDVGIGGIYPPDAGDFVRDYADYRSGRHLDTRFKDSGRDYRPMDPDVPLDFMDVRVGRYSHSVGDMTPPRSISDESLLDLPPSRSSSERFRGPSPFSKPGPVDERNALTRSHSIFSRMTGFTEHPRHARSTPTPSDPSSDKTNTHSNNTDIASIQDGFISEFVSEPITKGSTTTGVNGTPTLYDIDRSVLDRNNKRIGDNISVSMDFNPNWKANSLLEPSKNITSHIPLKGSAQNDTGRKRYFDVNNILKGPALSSQTANASTKKRRIGSANTFNKITPGSINIPIPFGFDLATSQKIIVDLSRNIQGITNNSNNGRANAKPEPIPTIDQPSVIPRTDVNRPSSDTSPNNREHSLRIVPMIPKIPPIDHTSTPRRRSRPIFTENTAQDKAHILKHEIRNSNLAGQIRTMQSKIPTGDQTHLEVSLQRAPVLQGERLKNVQTPTDGRFHSQGKLNNRSTSTVLHPRSDIYPRSEQLTHSNRRNSEPNRDNTIDSKQPPPYRDEILPPENNTKRDPFTTRDSQLGSKGNLAPDRHRMILDIPFEREPRRRMPPKRLSQRDQFLPQDLRLRGPIHSSRRQGDTIPNLDGQIRDDSSRHPPRRPFRDDPSITRQSNTSARRLESDRSRELRGQEPSVRRHNTAPEIPGEQPQRVLSTNKTEFNLGPGTRYRDESTRDQLTQSRRTNINDSIFPQSLERQGRLSRNERPLAEEQSISRLQRRKAPRDRIPLSRRLYQDQPSIPPDSRSGRMRPAVRALPPLYQEDILRPPHYERGRNRLRIRQSSAGRTYTDKTYPPGTSSSGKHSRDTPLPIPERPSPSSRSEETFLSRTPDRTFRSETDRDRVSRHRRPFAEETYLDPYYERPYRNDLPIDRLPPSETSYSSGPSAVTPPGLFGEDALSRRLLPELTRPYRAEPSATPTVDRRDRRPPIRKPDINQTKYEQTPRDRVPSRSRMFPEDPPVASSSKRFGRGELPRYRSSQSRGRSRDEYHGTPPQERLAVESTGDRLLSPRRQFRDDTYDILSPEASSVGQLDRSHRPPGSNISSSVRGSEREIPRRRRPPTRRPFTDAPSPQSRRRISTGETTRRRVPRRRRPTTRTSPVSEAPTYERPRRRRPISRRPYVEDLPVIPTRERSRLRRPTRRRRPPLRMSSTNETSFVPYSDRRSDRELPRRRPSPRPPRKRVYTNDTAYAPPDTGFTRRRSSSGRRTPDFRHYVTTPSTDILPRRLPSTSRIPYERPVSLTPERSPGREVRRRRPLPRRRPYAVETPTSERTRPSSERRYRVDTAPSRRRRPSRIRTSRRKISSPPERRRRVPPRTVSREEPLLSRRESSSTPPRRRPVPTRRTFRSRPSTSRSTSASLTYIESEPLPHDTYSRERHPATELEPSIRRVPPVGRLTTEIRSLPPATEAPVRYETPSSRRQSPQRTDRRMSEYRTRGTPLRELSISYKSFAPTSFTSPDRTSPKPISRTDTIAGIRLGVVRARGGENGFPVHGGYCPGERCADGGLAAGVANGTGTGTLDAFLKRRRTGVNEDITAYKKGLGSVTVT